MIKAFIFDLDGVIVDTAKYHYLAWQQLADFLEIPFSEKENETMKGISRMASLERLLELGNLSISDADKEKYCAIKNIWYLEHIEKMGQDEILPGVLNIIDEAKNAGLGIALGSASKNARTILNKVNLTDSFDVIIDGNDVVNSKPDPEVFSRGAQLMGYLPSETVVFEDSAKGIDAAIAGGFRTVGIGSEIHLNHADMVISDLSNFSIKDLNLSFSEQGI